MREQILKVGNGRVYGVSNTVAQPGKRLRIYDGVNMRVNLSLDEAFPDREITLPDGSVEYEPGVIFNVVFVTELRVVTDGDGLSFYWQ